MEATSNSTIGFQVYMKLEESEARALAGLTRYGFKSFIEVFYKHLGTDVMKPHEEGLKSLFSSIDNLLPKHLSRIDKTRKTFQDENPKSPSLTP